MLTRLYLFRYGTRTRPWIVQLRSTLVPNSSSGRIFLLAYRLFFPFPSNFILSGHGSPFPILSLQPLQSPMQSIPIFQFLIKVKASLSEQLFSLDLNSHNHLLSPQPCCKFGTTSLLAILNLECLDVLPDFIFIQLLIHGSFASRSLFPAPQPCLSVRSYLPTLLHFVLWLTDSQLDSSYPDAQSSCSSFFSIHIYTVDFNFLLPYFLLHFHPQSLALTNTLFLLPTSSPTFPTACSPGIHHLQPHILSHVPGHVPMSCSVATLTFPCYFNPLIRVFFQVSSAQQESHYQPHRSET